MRHGGSRCLELRSPGHRDERCHFLERQSRVVAGLHGTNVPIAYPSDDAIYPNGQKKTREEIVRFMQTRVMPWARQALAPIAGGSSRVTCNTCHGLHPEASGWHMPGSIVKKRA